MPTAPLRLRSGNAYRVIRSVGFDKVTCPPSRYLTEVPLPWECNLSAKSIGTSRIRVWLWTPLSFFLVGEENPAQRSQLFGLLESQSERQWPGVSLHLKSPRSDPRAMSWGAVYAGHLEKLGPSGAPGLVLLAGGAQARQRRIVPPRGGEACRVLILSPACLPARPGLVPAWGL